MNGMTGNSHEETHKEREINKKETSGESKGVIQLTAARLPFINIKIFKIQNFSVFILIIKHLLDQILKREMARDPADRQRENRL